MTNVVRKNPMDPPPTGDQELDDYKAYWSLDYPIFKHSFFRSQLQRHKNCKHFLLIIWATSEWNRCNITQCPVFFWLWRTHRSSRYLATILPRNHWTRLLWRTSCKPWQAQARNSLSLWRCLKKQRNDNGFQIQKGGFLKWGYPNSWMVY